MGKTTILFWPEMVKSYNNLIIDKFIEL